MVGSFDVTGQSDSPRQRLFNWEQIMDAPSGEDERSLIVSAREEALVERRRQNTVVDREPSSFISWTGERLGLPAHGLLSRMSITTRSRTALPPAEASLEHEDGLPVSSQSIPPVVRVSNVDGFSWVIDEHVRDNMFVTCLDEQLFVTENDG